MHRAQLGTKCFHIFPCLNQNSTTFKLKKKDDSCGIVCLSSVSEEVDYLNFSVIKTKDLLYLL